MENDEYVGCAAVLVFLLYCVFALCVSVAVGIAVASWAGFACMAVFIAPWIAFSLIAYVRFKREGE